MPGIETVKLFCPNCNDIYTPPSSRFQGIDGQLVVISILYVPLTVHALRRLLWHNLCTLILPELPRARTSSVLQTALSFKLIWLPSLIC